MKEYHMDDQENPYWEIYQENESTNLAQLDIIY